MADLTIDYINDCINKEFSEQIYQQLTDINLMEEYKNSCSVKSKISILNNILDNHITDDDIKKSIISQYTIFMIPAGTKGVIRGKKFNSIIKTYILNLNLSVDIYDVCFEKICPSCQTNEIPDWYILNKSTNKVIIGMNQLALWGGGQQINRGFNYICNNRTNTNNSKLLCVVANKNKIKSNKKRI